MCAVGVPWSNFLLKGKHINDYRFRARIRAHVCVHACTRAVTFPVEARTILETKALLKELQTNDSVAQNFCDGIVHAHVVWDLVRTQYFLNSG